MAEIFHSFSGIDIHAVFGNTVFGELQMVQYRSTREKAPVYTMGSADLRTIARGKREVTGACVFVVFDRDTLLTAMNRDAQNQPHLTVSETANYDKNGPRADATSNNQAIQEGGSFDVFAGGSLSGNQLASAITQEAPANLADQLLPFDITLVGANEYGRVSKMVISGVELMSESGGISIDDLVLEKQVAFIARRISNWSTVEQS